MLVSGSEILDCIPQRPPLVMIDKLLFSTSEKAISGMFIDENNVLVENGFFSESGLIENIAQTAAAGVGYTCKLENKKVPVGFIASIKHIKIHQLPAVGTEITTEVQVINTIMEVSIVAGKVWQNEVLIAECEMRIFVRPEPK